MSKIVHVHIHRHATTDAGFDESKHKRAANGQFGSGGTPAPSGPSPAQIAKHSGKKVMAHKPGWALRADPELAAKFEAAEKRAKEKKLARETGAVGGGAAASVAKTNAWIEKRNADIRAAKQSTAGRFNPEAAKTKTAAWFAKRDADVRAAKKGSGTTDAGFEEGKHKRDESGKFTAGGMTAEQHQAKSDEHGKRASEKGFKGEGEHHANVSESHFQAGRALQQAAIAHKEGRTAGPNSSKDWMSRAEEHAKSAAGHAAKIAPKKIDSPANAKIQVEGRTQQLAELQKDMKSGKYSPEDMKILKEREASLKKIIASNQAKQGASWTAHNGDWDGAKTAGKKKFEEEMAEAKNSGDRTDIAIRIKTEAAAQQKKGSYLGAVLVGLANDYLDRV